MKSLSPVLIVLLVKLFFPIFWPGGLIRGVWPPI
ncbi:hypothetical protein C5S35_16285, partial [Candidatus Methanophagaceae archaeon]